MNNQVSAVQYIGEIARYLLNTPIRSEEKQHKIRFAFGNGLRKDIWDEFKTRFNIPRIAEFYASTEGFFFNNNFLTILEFLHAYSKKGNVQFWNKDDKPYSVGRIPPLVGKILPVGLVRFDVQRDEPMRDANGFCIRCKPGEVGEAIGLILEDDTRRRFDGYTDKAATEKKILR